MGDWIEISRLRVKTKVGVPDDERATAQEVEISLRMKPSNPLRDLGDELDATVDYYAVSRRVIEVAERGERRLIETLAEEIADAVLAEFAVRRLTVEVRKFILPDTEFVAVHLSRKA